MADGGDVVRAKGTVWRWTSATHPASGWFFMTIEGQAAAEVRFAALGRTGGFGSVRVSVTVGATRWQTSLFPHRESGGYVLPLKAEVRKRESIAEGDLITVRISV